MAPGSLPAVVASAVLYGPCFMGGSALLAVWSYYTFPQKPSTGFTATILFVGLGTITGPAALGALADSHGLRAAFLVTALVAATTLLVHPGTWLGPSAGTGQPGTSTAATTRCIRAGAVRIPPAIPAAADAPGCTGRTRTGAPGEQED